MKKYTFLILLMILMGNNAIGAELNLQEHTVWAFNPAEKCWLHGRDCCKQTRAVFPTLNRFEERYAKMQADAVVARIAKDKKWQQTRKEQWKTQAGKEKEAAALEKALKERLNKTFNNNRKICYKAKDVRPPLHEAQLQKLLADALTCMELRWEADQLVSKEDVKDLFIQKLKTQDALKVANDLSNLFVISINPKTPKDRAEKYLDLDCYTTSGKNETALMMLAAAIKKHWGTSFGQAPLKAAIASQKPDSQLERQYDAFQIEIMRAAEARRKKIDGE